MSSALRVVRPIGRRGQVVIPKDIRRHLHLREGGEVAFELREGRVELTAPDAGAFLEQFFGLPKLPGPSPDAQTLKDQMAQEHDEVP